MSIQDLPVELLTEIISHLPSISSCANLAATCHRLNSYMEEDGWKATLRRHFPSYAVAGFGRDALQSLSSLSRNWDRRAFLARYLRIPGCNAGHRHQHQRRQTMGFHPVIDSFEIHQGSKWDERLQIAAFGVGTNLAIRIKRQRSSGSEISTIHSDNRGVVEAGTYDYDSIWFNHRPKNAREGRDDITALKLLRPGQINGQLDLDAAQVILGTADGELLALKIESKASKGQHFVARSRYDTRHQPVRSIDISPATGPLLAASLGKSTVALFETFCEDWKTPAQALSEVDVGGDGNVSRIRSNLFLSDDKLIMVRSHITEPLHLYDVRPTGFGDGPSRVFKVSDPTALKCVAGLPNPTAEYGMACNTFLSGGYDGIVRLHDIRSSRDCEMIFKDDTNFSSVLSIAAIARERLLVGTARNAMMRVFDLRIPGGRVYDYVNANPKIAHQVAESKRRANLSKVGESVWQPGCNIFLFDRRFHYGTSESFRTRQSPVYAISSPASWAPTVFVGLEGCVVQLDITDITERRPGSEGPANCRRDYQGAIHNASTGTIYKDVLSLGMHEHTENFASRLHYQLHPGRTSAQEAHLDERWRKVQRNE